MKFIGIFVVSAVVYFIPPNGSVEVLKMMHNYYAGKWFTTFTFNQTT